MRELHLREIISSLPKHIRAVRLAASVQTELQLLNPVLQIILIMLKLSKSCYKLSEKCDIYNVVWDDP